MKRRSIVYSAVLATMLATALPAATSAGTDQPAATAEAADLGGTLPVERGEFDSYIVVMKSDPLVVTEGQDNLQTTRATNRGEEKKSKHKDVLRDSGVAPDKIMSDLVYAVDGFAANVTYDEAVRIASHKDVALVLPDQLMQPTTDSSPDFLGLTGAAGPWSTGVTGEGVVVGIIDTGIWPEHPSFADNGLSAPPIPALQDVVVDGPNGPYEIDACDFGNSAHNANDAAFTCNDKLVGARQVLPAYRQLIGADAFEFDSARDDDGHGTHTSSTAAGNADVEASIFGNDLGTISGIAPDAHVIMYKGLGAQGGFGSDLALAIDLAVFDGVDVINYSIGGGGQTITVDEISFLFAANAGVHVATSAGNNGPGAATIGNPAKVPWLTTVGASTQDRFWQGTVELGDGTVIEGSSVTPGTSGEVRLVDGEDAGDPLCQLNSLDPDMVDGAIVLCQRGAPARIMTTAEVLQAGGVGVILYNNDDVDNLFTDSFHVPTVMIDNTEGLQIKSYIDAAGDDATAEIRDTATESTWPSAPSIAKFSSRGPNVFGDVIKPDVTAPGFQILAGNSPFPGPILGGAVPRVQGELFQSIAGTSMSSPHVAGLFALLDQVHPDWTAAEARSALMTTAHQDVVDNDRVSPAGPFAQGAGHVDPGSAVHKGSAFQPGLAYDAGLNEYFGFLCDAFPGVFANPAGTCAGLEAAGIPIVASDLNYPSISVDEVPGSITVTRSVTSVAKESGNRLYTAEVEAPAGYSVSVSPSSFSLKKGQTQTFEVTITNESAPLGEWRFGSLTWNEQDGEYSVRSPIAVKGAPLAAPSAVTVAGTEGSSSIDVQFGYSGAYTAAAHGFAADAGELDTVADDADQTCQCDGTGGPGEVAHPFALSGSAHLRIALDISDLPGGDPNTDIDLFLKKDGAVVAQSTSGGTAEIIDMPFPEDGNYTLWVHGWSVPDGVVSYMFHRWDVPETPNAGSLVIDSAPGAAVIGTTGTVEFSWSGLDPDQTYLGAISHETGVAPLQLTLVEADT
jgi:subtilisin family serine protease